MKKISFSFLIVLCLFGCSNKDIDISKEDKETIKNEINSVLSDKLESENNDKEFTEDNTVDIDLSDINFSDIDLNDIDLNDVGVNDRLLDESSFITIEEYEKIYGKLFDEKFLEESSSIAIEEYEKIYGKLFDDSSNSGDSSPTND